MPNRISISIVFILAAVFFCCCDNRVNPYDHTAVVVELGNDFYYLGDGRESQILVNLRPKSKSKVGKTIIPPEVIQYNFDTEFIIAQTVERENGEEIYKYWIVEKNGVQKGSITSLNSMNFHRGLDSLQIKMKLEARK
jgi:hypothetical protein